MLSKVSYCSLDEAWNLCQPLDNQNGSAPESTTLEIGGYQLDANPVDSVQLGTNPHLSNKQLVNNNMESDFAAFIRDKQDSSEQHKQNMKNIILQDKGRLCDLFLKHIDECESCKAKMMQKFGSKMIEKFENLAGMNNNTNYFEIGMIILIGVIIIVIMDSFVRLGKIMKK